MEKLLTTKLRRPALLKKRVGRSELIQRLNAGWDSGHQVFLVSAPAGFGKTSCVSEWVESCASLRVAWLSLDTADDDPGRFFIYFLAALREIHEQIGHDLAVTLRAGQLLPVEMISTTLINDIQDFERDFLLVLDDFHVIQDHLILSFLEKFVTHLPRPLRIALITREDPPLPLAQLRANNCLTEIRAQDLRFNRDDIGRFLNTVMGLSVSPGDIEILEDKTEGWIVGLQLAGLSVRDREDASAFISNLSGSHRYILGYLTEQVLNRQSEETREFLLQTSILEKLNGDLCNAVTDRSDSRFLLEQLFNANLFLIPLDDGGEWYRYHHLFADLLQSLQKARLPERTAELHRRASLWYARADMMNEAIRHALAAEDFARSVELLEGHALKMVTKGYAKTVNGWVSSLPAEWRLQSPRAHLALAWTHLLRGAYSHASPYLERLEGFYSSTLVDEEEKQSFRAEWLVMRALLLSMKGEMTESLAVAEEALEIVPKEDHRVYSLAHFGLATVYQATEEYKRAMASYQMAIQYSRSAENTIVEMLSTSGLAVMALEHGRLNLAREVAAPVTEQIEHSGSLPPISTVVFGIVGEVCYQWCQIERARHYTQRALHLSTLGGYSSGMISCRVLLSRLARLEGDLDVAVQEIRSAIGLLGVETPGYVRREAVSQQVRVFLTLDQMDAAELTLQAQGFSFGDRFFYPEPSQDRGFSHSEGLLYNSSLFVLIQRARVSRDQAYLDSGIDLANLILGRALASQFVLIALETLLLRAQMYALKGERGASQADYLNALEMAAPEGCIAVFVEQGQPAAEALGELVEANRLGAAQAGHVERILGVFSGFHPPDDGPVAPVRSDGAMPMGLIEPLTQREKDVLRLMAEGLKYKEIAAKLFISQNTVRYHVKSLYSKLHANNRTQAILKARQLQIM